MRVFDWREKREEKRCEMFMMVVLVFFLLLVGKVILIFEMVSGMRVLEPSICSCWQYSLFLFMG